MLYPLIFHPLFKERVWGGRQLERLYGKQLPAGAPFGESWEIADRLGDCSVVANGSLKGRDLRWLMENHATELVGSLAKPGERFPWLVKILDARQTLSLQVHPPAAKAAELGGEPKTEMWYVAEADPGAELFAGLKRGVTEQEFRDRLKVGTVAECFHRLRVRKADAMFLPSGRVHALGQGLVIFEIQQNSDTTYRVFDWNRVGLDGKPRELHIPQSLASIDFQDFEPRLADSEWTDSGQFRTRSLAEDKLFKVTLCEGGTGAVREFPPRMRVIGAVSGKLSISMTGAEPVRLRAGEFCLVPACGSSTLQCAAPATFLVVE